MGTNNDIVDGKLARPTRDNKMQLALFDINKDWENEWWGMPEFIMGDARPQYRIVVNFMTIEDIKDFANKLGLPSLSSRTDSIWYPLNNNIDKPKEWAYVG
jgi:hypothetical protein